MMKTYKSISAYISAESGNIRKNLELIRKTIQQVAPKATEAIKYGIPTYVLMGKNLIHFATFNTHYGLYPGSQAIIVFKKELTNYDCSKGTIRFPLDKKIPVGLISRIVKYRVKAVLGKSKK